MITLHWCPQTRAERMFWLLQEIGEPYAINHIDFRDPDAPRGADFLAASPLGKLPALSDGHVHVADSAAIALYLADRYSMGDLAPALDDPMRGPYLFWMFYTPSALEPAITEKMAKLEPRPTAYPWGSFDRMTGAFEARLKDHDWLAGNRFTMADAMMAGSIAYLAAFGMYQPTPGVQAFLDRCQARPAFAAAQKRLEAAKADLG